MYTGDVYIYTQEIRFKASCLVCRDQLRDETFKVLRI